MAMARILAMAGGSPAEGGGGGGAHDNSLTTEVNLRVCPAIQRGVVCV